MPATYRNRKYHIDCLKKYIFEVKQVQKDDFDKWFEGKKQVMENIGAYLLLIEQSKD